MIQCGVRDKVKMRWQKREKEEVKCFRCWGVRYQKWECPNIEVERERRAKKKVVCVARPQKAWQERRLACSIWEKAQEYCNEWSMPPEGSLLLDRGWTIEEVVAIYVDCGGCKGRGVQIHEN